MGYLPDLRLAEAEIKSLAQFHTLSTDAADGNARV